MYASGLRSETSEVGHGGHVGVEPADFRRPDAIIFQPHVCLLLSTMCGCCLYFQDSGTEMIPDIATVVSRKSLLNSYCAYQFIARKNDTSTVFPEVKKGC